MASWPQIGCIVYLPAVFISASSALHKEIKFTRCHKRKPGRRIRACCLWSWTGIVTGVQNLCVPFIRITNLFWVRQLIQKQTESGCNNSSAFCIEKRGTYQSRERNIARHRSNKCCLRAQHIIGFKLSRIILEIHFPIQDTLQQWWWWWELDSDMEMFLSMCMYIGRRRVFPVPLRQYAFIAGGGGVGGEGFFIRPPDHAVVTSNEGMLWSQVHVGRPHLFLLLALSLIGVIMWLFLWI